MKVSVIQRESRPTTFLWYSTSRPHRRHAPRGGDAVGHVWGGRGTCLEWECTETTEGWM